MTHNPPNPDATACTTCDGWALVRVIKKGNTLEVKCPKCYRDPPWLLP